jgi:hypothetical protein
MSKNIKSPVQGLPWEVVVMLAATVEAVRTDFAGTLAAGSAGDRASRSDCRFRFDARA